MNIEKMRAVRAHIEALPERNINMGYFFIDGSPFHGNDCGTVCCIAGWTIALETKLKEPHELKHYARSVVRTDPELEARPWISMPEVYVAAKILELPHEDAFRLFVPTGNNIGEMDTISKSEVLLALDRCIQQGAVPQDVWSHVVPKDPEQGWID
jgi:hypothetical protein